MVLLLSSFVHHTVAELALLLVLLKLMFVGMLQFKDLCLLSLNLKHLLFLLVLQMLFFLVVHLLRVYPSFVGSRRKKERKKER